MILDTTGPIRDTGKPILIEDYSGDLGDFLEQRAVEGLILSPTSSAFRSQELAMAEGRPLSGAVTRALRKTPFGQLFDDRFERQLASHMKLSPVMTAEDANKKAKEAGLPLSFKKPIREETLNIVMERKRAELRRRSLFDQMEHVRTFGLGTASEIVATALDPLNLASAFVPVVGQARYAAWAARSVTRARLARGAIEGSVGAALVEPLVLTAANEEQAEYDLLDSLLNVAFGGILGGGLHLAFGRVGDLMRGAETRARVERSNIALSERIDAARHETREAALRVAVSEILATGRVASVGKVLEADPAYRAYQDIDTLLSSSGVETVQRRLDLAGQGVEFRFRQGETVEPYNLTREEYGRAKEIEAETKARETVDGLERDIDALEREIAASKNKKGNAARRETLARLKRELKEAPEQARARAAEAAPQEHRASVARAADEGTPVPERVLEDYPEIPAQPLPDAPDIEPVVRSARENETSSLADFLSSRQADDLMKTANAEDNADAAAALLAEEQEAFDRLAEQIGVDPKTVEIDEVEDLAAAYQAAVTCRMRS